MRDLIDLRLAELRAELESGRRLQAELDNRQEELRRSMLRISGAIQVLGELSAAADARDAVAHGDVRGDLAIDRATDAPPPLRRVVDQ